MAKSVFLQKENDVLGMHFLPIPDEAFRVLSEEAAKRNMTFAELIGKAIDCFLEKPMLETTKI